jgi:nicotinate-nucleotide--dimethylbenzimidazole phosphoribosyltransferase
LSQGPARPAGLGWLAAVGGAEHATLAGALLAAVRARVPVLLDGVVTCAAALAAVAAVPGAVGGLVAGHRSAEPGATIALDHLALSPLLDAGLRLGEGSGALLALPIVQAAARVLGDVATLADLGADPPG